MQAEHYTQSRKNLDTALSLSHQASSQYSTDLNATKASILNEVQKTNLSNLQQGIRYQLGRLGVISEQDIKLSIHALNDFITGPSHPSYEAHWANLRLAQLLHLDGQISKAKELVTRLPDIDNGQYSKLKKKLMRKLR